jgi:hypothetical protein
MYIRCCHCHVVIELKMKAFKPEFADKMNSYLSIVGDQLCCVNYISNTLPRMWYKCSPPNVV